MKIFVDRKNKVVVAKGSVKGKKIKAVSRCNVDDTFDEKFGVEYTTKKYAVKESMAKADCHVKYVKALYNLVNWCNNQLDYELDILHDMYDRIAKKQADCDTFVKNYFDGKVEE